MTWVLIGRCGVVALWNCSLRELKEALFRLRVVRETGYLGPEYDSVIEETLELKRIMASLVRRKNAATPQRRNSQ